MLSLDRYKTESMVYHLTRATVLAGLLYSCQYGFDVFGSIGTALIVILGSVVVQLFLMIKLPGNDIIPINIYRSNFGDFIKGEIKFVLISIFVIFFAGVNYGPKVTALLLAGNLILQSILFSGWWMYNKSLSHSGKKSSRSKKRKKVVILGASERGKTAANIFLDHPELNTDIIGFMDCHQRGLWRYRDVPLIGHTDDIRNIISKNQVDYVVFAMEKEDHRNGQTAFNTVESMGIKACLLPDFYQTSFAKCRTFSLNGQSAFLFHSVPDNRAALLVKEIIDRVGATVGLILSVPIIFVAALAIRFDSKGPIFYKQKRFGKNGRVFKMIKLRTMVNEADRFKEKLEHLNEMSGPVFKIQEDPRITKVGKFLRKYSIDEFPQFYNVLKGDMSLVGPRPPLPEEVEKFEPWQHRKLSVKPGLSCLWQINGRNNVDFDYWMKLDLQYIDQWSLRRDAEILVKTIPAVLKGKGAS